MGYQQFFRKPQLHRPCTPAAHPFPPRRHRSNEFFEGQEQKQVRPTPIFPVAAAAPPANPRLLPLAANLITGLLVFLSGMILLMLAMVR